jgi:transcriptional regulator of arginine metabolism
MNTSKRERQRAIVRLVSERRLSTQGDVAAALRGEGMEAVQATVSRDIAELGLVKVRGEDGRLAYAPAAAADRERLTRLESALGRWLAGVEVAAGLVVLRTPPGYASALALALDEAALAEVAGCIAGDDTIFVAPRDGTTAGELAAILGAS